MAKIMEMTKEEQNQRSFYLYNTIKCRNSTNLSNDF